LSTALTGAVSHRGLAHSKEGAPNVSQVRDATYTNALDQLIKRIGSDSDSDITVVRGVLHGAMALYLTRYLNVPPARSACSTITGPWCGNATIVQQDRPYVPLRGL
jgi:hypothetical protein